MPPLDFLGVSSSVLLKVFAGFAAAIVVLYILKLRRRRVPVPYVKLWQKVLVERPTSSLFSQLKRLLSLLIQLLLLALMTLAIADPRVKAPSTTGRSLVVLLDGSASMKATDMPNRQERWRDAQQTVRRLIRELGSNDRMLLAQMDMEITPLSPLTDEIATLDAALQEYHPKDTGLDFSRALRFALDATQGANHPEIIVVGDGAFGASSDSLGAVRIPPTIPLRFVSTGRTGRNVGISAFSARRYPLDKSRYEVLVEVRNYSAQPERVELKLSASGAPLEITTLELGPTGSPTDTRYRVLPDQSGANQALEASIRLADQTSDDLPADDHAYATLPERRKARILVVSPGNLYLQAALLLDEYLTVEDATQTEALSKLQQSRYDLVVLDGVTIPLPPNTNAIYLRPTGPDSPLELDGADETAATMTRPAFDRIESRHPLMRWMSDIEDTNISTGLRYRLQNRDRAVASSQLGPLVVVGERRGAKFVAVTFNPVESDLPLRVSWPVLLINSIDWFAGEDPANLSSFRTGETWRIPVPAGTDSAELILPEGAQPRRTLRLPVIEGRAVATGTVAGIYEVRTATDRQFIAGNLVDPSESRCAPSQELRVGDVRASAPVPGKVGVRRELWIYLVLGALVIILIEWWTYHRRITV